MSFVKRSEHRHAVRPPPSDVIAHLRRAAKQPREAFFRNDPVQLVHRYADPGDQEVVALLAALLAFGKVKAFLRKLAEVLEVVGPKPRAYALDYRPSRDLAFYRRFRCRIWQGDDLRLFWWNLRAILEEHGRLEDAFLASDDATAQAEGSIQLRLRAFAALFYRADPSAITRRGEYPRSYRHLVADPASGGACKRWNLFLRWMVRPADGVDLGIWKRVSPADLVIPLDIHVGRISSLIGLRRRRTNDWKAAEEVTASLRAVAPRDPLCFDFPLSHLGISGHCRGRWVEEVCGSCAIAPICQVARARRRRARRLVTAGDAARAEA